MQHKVRQPRYPRATTFAQRSGAGQRERPAMTIVPLVGQDLVEPGEALAASMSALLQVPSSTASSVTRPPELLMTDGLPLSMAIRPACVPGSTVYSPCGRLLNAESNVLSPDARWHSPAPNGSHKANCSA